MRLISFVATTIYILTPDMGWAHDFRLELPTENKAILSGSEADYFQPTISKRIKSGTFGYVRSTDSQEPPRFYNQFHEGLDVKPVRRDENGEPLDPVLASAAGTVVYLNERSGKSNYGKYVMVEHDFRGFKGFTLYAHLNTITCRTGQKVTTGDALGSLGYTGAGINKERAHLHFEFNVMINRHFAEWFDRLGKGFDKDPNDHGVYNGINFNGFDPLPLLTLSTQSEPMTGARLFQLEKPQFKILIPAGRDYWDFQKRYSFTVEEGIEKELPNSWIVTFNRIGTPIRFQRSSEEGEIPKLLWFDHTLGYHRSYSRGLVTHTTDKKAEISGWGHKWLSLLTFLPD
ncbi:MAG: M23 family metallopeptidase [Verrucomicrobiota bacterium]|nr:M23 family metallopeptidase [Verrucomicrobiota bacterium]